MDRNPTRRVHLILALHNHQPEGNLPEVFERTYRDAYEPFIRELAMFPAIKVTIHFSGILLNWIRQNKPELVELLRELVTRGQVELMGGAFYEPILVMIPDEDKIGQIKKQTRLIKELFGAEVHGAWLAERVWEPHLALPLAKAGIKYTVLDDAHFHHIGFKEEDTHHYFVTEESGERLAIFPINEKMRYLVPFADAAETIAYLRQVANEEGNRVVVLADDGEKFGSWPGTAKHVYQNGWLKKFFSLLVENRDWLHTTTFHEFMAKYPPAGRAYLPCGSYREMMEWSGGFWRNFFVRYPESNHPHKKMLYVRKKIARLPEGEAKEKAMDLLWAGQCNCAYWHGIFGGLYLNFLRHALYNRLIGAEVLAEQELHGGESWLEAERTDFDLDGKEELIISSPELGLVFAPQEGGSLLELSYKPKRFNLLDVLARRPEPYHCNLFELSEGVCDDEEARSIHHRAGVKEAGLERLLVYDSRRRTSLADRFLDPAVTLDAFLANPDKFEIGSFAGRPYRVEEFSANGAAKVVMSREAPVAGTTVFLSKTILYQPASGKINCHYSITNKGRGFLSARFGVELNLNLLAGQAPDRYYTVPGHVLQERHLGSTGQTENVESLSLTDEWQGLVAAFTFEKPALLWRMPIETVSQSEAGMERVFQGSSILPSWELNLAPGENWNMNIVLNVGPLERELN